MARFGWRAMFLGLGVITLLWLWPWLAVTRGGFSHAREEHGPLPVSYREILRQREFWGTALGHFASNYALYFVITWVPAFLVKQAVLPSLRWPESSPPSTASMPPPRRWRAWLPIARSPAAALPRACARRTCSP